VGRTLLSAALEVEAAVAGLRTRISTQGEKKVKGSGQECPLHTRAVG